MRFLCLVGIKLVNPAKLLNTECPKGILHFLLCPVQVFKDNLIKKFKVKFLTHFKEKLLKQDALLRVCPHPPPLALSKSDFLQQGAPAPRRIHTTVHL